MSLKKRQEISVFDQWNLQSVYVNNKAWEYHLQELTDKLLQLEVFKGKLNTADIVLDCLNLFFEIDRGFEKLYIYAASKLDEDLSNKDSNIIKGKVRDFLTSFNSAISFIESELSQKEPVFLKKLLSDNRFKDYDCYLKQIIREKKHLLSLPEEELLAKTTEIFGLPNRIYNKLSDNDLEFPHVHVGKDKFDLTHGTYHSLLTNQKRHIRKKAMTNMLSTYSQFRSTFCEVLSAHIKKNVVMARIRKYPFIMDKFLHSEDIPVSVYQTLFKVTNENLHLLHRYCEIRKKKMGLRSLHWYDLYVPLIKGVKNTYTYDESVEMVLAAVAPLGDEYVKILRAGLTSQSWIDKYENKGKVSGAYSSGGYDTMPFILLNFDSTLNSVFTKAHEAGHSMHTYLSSKAQSYTKYGYTIFIAEIASIVNEQLLNNFLLKDADSKMKAFLINQELENIRTTFFRQTLFAEFEAILYEYVWSGGVLTPDFIEEKYYELNCKYYGPQVVIDDVIRAEWSRIPHFFYDFYVYQYSTGLSCASYFSKQILQGGEKELGNYLGLLQAGGSDFPVNLLQNAGLNVTKDNYIISLLKKFEKLLDEFEKI